MKITENSLSSGSYFFDEFLEGGYPNGRITLIYGPPGSGKTNLCALSLIKNTNRQKKSIYLDSEGGFSITRLKQIISEKDADDILDNVLFLKPTNFEEQKNVFENKVLFPVYSVFDLIRYCANEIVNISTSVNGMGLDIFTETVKNRLAVNDLLKQKGKDKVDLEDR